MSRFRWPTVALLLLTGILDLTSASEPTSVEQNSETPKVNNYSCRSFTGEYSLTSRTKCSLPSKEVQYELHPSFNDPLQVRSDPANQSPWSAAAGENSASRS
jgi:hypothetical protein